MNEYAIFGKEVALLSDVHWGKSRDSDLKLNSLNEYFNWYLNIIIKRGIKEVIFLGDWFDNRNSISVKTLNQAYTTLKRFSECGIKVFMIVGNHDSYLKNSIKVNSTKPFADIKNIFPIEDLTEVHFTESGKKGLLCPWETLKDVQTNYDVLFGHFEFSGAYLKDSVFDGGCSLASILQYAPLAFSGHFHLKNTYPHKLGKLITVGSPIELDWGDLGNQKGLFILNTTSMEYDFIPNDFSPKHIRLYWSKIMAKTEDMKQVKGNYVKFVIDTNYKYEHVMKMKNIIDSLGPIIPCENDFIYDSGLNALEEFKVADESLLTMSKLEYMRKYIKEYFKNDDNTLDLTRMMRLTEDTYDKTEEK